MKIIDAELLQKELNPSQCKAALNINGPQLILAGAGSGKTRTITFKIAHLISHYKIDPRRILAVTFTNKAAGEMKERIHKLIEAPVNLAWMGTFHSTCMRFLRKCLSSPTVMQKCQWSYTSSFSIFDDADQKALIREILKAEFGEIEASEVKKIKSYISNCKNKNTSPEDAQQSNKYDNNRYPYFYAQYQKKLEQNNAMDFDDLLNNTVEVLKKDADMRARFSRQFQYLFVDEYQDTNPVQYEFLQLVIGPHQNITVVGDDDQSIYGWRGADIGIIRNFNNDFNNVEIVKLEQNYRSTSNIVKGAGSVIAHNNRPKDLAKEVFSLQEAGEKIKVITVNDEKEEARTIASQIFANKENNYEQTAVFYRTNAQSRVLEEQMNKSRIPCTIIGGIRFYDRKEIKDLFAYFKLLVNNNDSVALKRIINTPKRGIGATSILKLEELAAIHNQSLYSTLAHAGEVLSNAAATRVLKFYQMLENLKARQDQDPLPIFIEHVIEESTYRKSLVDEGNDESLERIANIDELLNGLVDYDQEHPNSKLEDYLQEMALLTDADIKNQKPVGVKLMTVHSAKGLEFPFVHLVGLDEGVFPLKHRMDSDIDEVSHYEEERRLFYVAATRAEKELSIYNANVRKVYGRDERFPKSRFVKEIDSSVIETKNLGDSTSDWGNSDTSGFKENWNSYQKKSRNSTYVDSNFSWSNSNKSKSSSQNYRKPISKSNGRVIAKPIPKTHKKTTSYDTDSQENLYLQIGSKVQHPKFGVGIVLSCSGIDESSRIEVEFKKAGVKKLILKYANLQIIG